jgi:peptidoglycan/xylan/chitin deacetylase (PgdA/CDA1 family)
MIIGSHGCSHQLLSKLNPRSQKKEIVDSFLTLSNLKILSSEIKTFCYPYGGFHSFTDYTESLLGSLCVSFSVNVEPRDCTANDIELRPHALPRYDCNIFPFGKATFVHPPVA